MFPGHPIPWPTRKASDPWRWVRLGLAILLLSTMAGCAHRPPAAAPAKIAGLKSALLSLAPTVADTDADRVARCAYDHPRTLAAEYQVVRPALLHNFLVNTGARERGLCHEWAEDLLAQLRTLDFGSFELHWGVAREGTNREHNCVVVTARGQPFDQGVVLDAWRHGGSLFWSRVKEDHYPWVEKDRQKACGSADHRPPSRCGIVTIQFGNGG